MYVCLRRARPPPQWYGLADQPGSSVLQPLRKDSLLNKRRPPPCGVVGWSSVSVVQHVVVLRMLSSGDLICSVTHRVAELSMRQIC